jgi:RNA polymerase sigma-70 factor (ECF subfamily)
MAGVSGADPGPSEAWVAAFRATLPELYAFVARRVGGERALAEDVTQETWLRAVKAWRSSGPPREPIAWLKTTARRLLLNHFRDERRRPLVRADANADLDRLDPELARPLAQRDGEWTPDAAALVQRGLARLGAKEAALVEAFHLDGRTTRELAAEIGASERAVEGRLHRARRKLKQILGNLVERSSR